MISMVPRSQQAIAGGEVREGHSREGCSRRMARALNVGAEAPRCRTPRNVPKRLLGEESFPALPRVVAGFLVGGRGVGGFSGAHEAVARAVIGHWFEGFARGFHSGDGVWNRGADARVVAGVKAVNGRLDARHGAPVWRLTVEDERCGNIGAIGGEAE